MKPEKQDMINNLISRLNEEIMPLLEKSMTNGNIPYANPASVNCWEALDCPSTDCSHFSRGKDSGRCWQVEDACCNGKPQGNASQNQDICISCRVFQDSCPTIVEKIGEYINDMAFLLNAQKEQILEDRRHIEKVNDELSAAIAQLNIKNKEIQELRITDKLTTLFNRQHLITVLEDEISRCQRFGRPIALIMIDIDDFRSFNNAYGHQAGDIMLSFVGSLIKENTRKFDRAFRYGGEEFVVVLPESDLTMAYIVAERIRKGFENNYIPVTKKDDGTRESISRTISVGITASYAFGTQNISIDELIDQTESALNQSKEKGGNICTRHE